MSSRAGIAAALMLIWAAAGYGQSPTPRPFPQPGAPPPAPARPGTVPPALADPAAPPTQPVLPGAEAPPTEALLGVPLYPGAQFLASYDAGRGQRFYLFGTAASFVDLVNFYRNVLRQRGSQVFDVPATHEFDVGRFDDDTMAFPPGVTIKDFESQTSAGYPNPAPGGEPDRFRSIIQIVPAGPPR
ncbi:MAG: hypothetical protein IT176_04910 [Acidobacteria bacterium]|nr:hypothetical protein [Acidobacteriota bacterium]